MQKGLISVIITTYARKWKYLGRAIESVKKQTYKPIEILVVDDNGKGSPEQLENAGFLNNDESIIYIVNDNNKGAQYSRNIGILQSQGEYVAFLDDDDIWDSQKIEKQLLLFSNNVAMVGCNGYIIQGDDETPLRKYHDNSESQPCIIRFEDLLYDDYIGSTTQAIIKKECLSVCGLFDYEMPARQDYEMWIRISKFFDIAQSNECLFYHRIHSGEQISKSYKKSFVGHYLIFQKYRQDYKKYPRAKSKRILKLCVMSLFMKRYFKAICYFIRAFVVNPRCTIDTLLNQQVIK